MRALEVRIKGDASGIDNLLREVQTKTKNSVNNIQKSFTSIPGNIAGGFLAGFSAVGLKSFVDGILNAGKELKDLSEQMDMGSDDVQKWQKAVEKAGLSFSGFSRIVDAFTTKRIAARSEKGARDDLLGLGFTAKDILDTEGISASEFALRGLLAGRGSQEARGRLSQVVGSRGLKYIPAAELFAAQNPYYSPADLQTMQQAEDAERAFDHAATKSKAALFRFFTDRDYQRSKGAGLVRWFDKITGSWFLRDDMRQESVSDMMSRIESGDVPRIVKAIRTPEQARREKAIAEGRNPDDAIDDPLKKAQEEKLAKAREAHMERMRDLNRGEMDKAEQGVALKQEELRLRREIDDLESKSELSPEEQERLFHLQERKQGIRNSLFDINREASAKFETTPLERTGAVFGNSLLFNPLLQLNTAQLKESQRTNAILEQIKDRSPFF